MDTNFDQPPPSNTEPPKDRGLGLLRQLDQKAPLSPKSTEALQEEGWGEFYAYREFKNNGAVDVEHVELALAEIAHATAIPEDWVVCRARLDSVAHHPLEKDRMRALLKKATQARIDWEIANGYR